MPPHRRSQTPTPKDHLSSYKAKSPSRPTLLEDSDDEVEAGLMSERWRSESEKELMFCGQATTVGQRFNRFY